MTKFPSEFFSINTEFLILPLELTDKSESKTHAADEGELNPPNELPPEIKTHIHNDGLGLKPVDVCVLLNNSVMDRIL